MSNKGMVSIELPSEVASFLWDICEAFTPAHQLVELNQRLGIKASVSTSPTRDRLKIIKTATEKALR